MHALNPQQQAAVTHLGTPLLVLAGAGSGKTSVITQKIAWLIRKANYDARQIAAITFTNKAAREMKERVMQLLDKEEAKGLTVSTFHTLGLNILKREVKKLGYKSGFSILDAQDSATILKELALKDDIEEVDDIRWQISRWKNDFINPQQAMQQALNELDMRAARLYEKYQRQIRAYNAVDFDDLIVMPVQLFDQYPDVLETWQNRLRYLLIDEYQDTNACQYRLIRQLAGVSGAITAVGDDDQSIYAWRGADVSHILNFSNDWSDAKVVWLEENYRSTAAILEMANRLIAFNTERNDKVLRPFRPKGTQPRILQHKDELTEAKLVVGEIKHLIENEHIQPRDIAILFRTNEQPRLFETELRKADVPYVMLGSQSFFDRREVRDLIAYMKWISQPDDEVALLRIANTPARGLSTKSIRLLIERAVERGVSVWQVMQTSSALADLSPAARAGIDDLKALQHDVSERASNETLTKAMETLLARTRYMDEIARLYDEPLERDARTASIGELTNALSAFEDGREAPDLSGFLSDIALSGKEMGNEKDKLALKNSVWLLTMHAAKGLEFPVVYMVGLEQDILPHSRSVKSGREEDIAEERRLCYVGITRAQEKLTLSLALTRRRWGKPRPTTPSQFLYEITGKADNPNQYRKSKKKLVKGARR